MTDANEDGNIGARTTAEGTPDGPVPAAGAELDTGSGTEADAAASPGRDWTAKVRAARPWARSHLASPRVGASLVLLLVVMTALAFVQWRRSSSLAADAKTQRDIATTAGSFGEALLSYDFDDVTVARDRVVKLATEEFGKSYSETFRAGLGTIIASLQATAEATVRDVFVTEASGDRAKAVVVLDSKIRSLRGLRELIGSYLEMELRREGGRWKVDAVSAVAAAKDTITKPSPQPKE